MFQEVMSLALRLLELVSDGTELKLRSPLN